MTLVLLNNTKNMLKMSTHGDTITNGYTDKSGTVRDLYTMNVSYASFNPLPFYCTATQSSPWTACDKARLFAYASGDTNIQQYVTAKTDYAPHTTIGTCSCQATTLSNKIGWSMAITVTGTPGDVINSFYFTRSLQYSGANYSNNTEACVFAIELDRPVTIDSTGKAYFTFAIKFD